MGSPKRWKMTRDLDKPIGANCIFETRRKTRRKPWDAIQIPSCLWAAYCLAPVNWEGGVREVWKVARDEDLHVRWYCAMLEPICKVSGTIFAVEGFIAHEGRNVRKGWGIHPDTRLSVFTQVTLISAKRNFRFRGTGNERKSRIRIAFFEDDMGDYLKLYQGCPQQTFSTTKYFSRGKLFGYVDFQLGFSLLKSLVHSSMRISSPIISYDTSTHDETCFHFGRMSVCQISCGLQ